MPTRQRQRASSASPPRPTPAAARRFQSAIILVAWLNGPRGTAARRSAAQLAPRRVTASIVRNSPRGLTVSASVTSRLPAVFGLIVTVSEGCDRSTPTPSTSPILPSASPPVPSASAAAPDTAPPPPAAPFPTQVGPFRFGAPRTEVRRRCQEHGGRPKGDWGTGPVGCNFIPSQEIEAALRIAVDSVGFWYCEEGLCEVVLVGHPRTTAAVGNIEAALAAKFGQQTQGWTGGLTACRPPVLDLQGRKTWVVPFKHGWRWVDGEFLDLRLHCDPTQDLPRASILAWYATREGVKRQFR
jgi:hypothetical protein